MTGRKHLTHLTAWRAFEAATRHSSFVLAARELSVTPAAVSQQVRTLEGYLGVTLFIRTKRGVTPTAAAAAILPELTAALDHLNRTIARLRRRRSGDVVTVTVLMMIPLMGLYEFSILLSRMVSRRRIAAAAADN